jgi:NAD(P)-dependent dehydrogenase (short-subunit alcohol dehydrogenase family)
MTGVLLITGGGRGIGAAAKGYRAAVNYRAPKTVAQPSRRSGSRPG